MLKAEALRLGDFAAYPVSETTMGLFDSIIEDCPLCKYKNGLEFQSKSGPCAMDIFTLENAPIDVLIQAGAKYEVRCRGCGKRFHLEFDIQIELTRPSKFSEHYTEDKSARKIVCDEW